jgi:hypothetical protein
MAYFPNGTAHEVYRDAWCSKCIHDQAEGGCMVMFLHMLHNYDEANKKDSYLHSLIPQDAKTGEPKECSMFLPSLEDRPAPAHMSRCPVCNDPYHGAMCRGVSING